MIDDGEPDHGSPGACPTPSTPEPLWVEPVISRTMLLTQTINVTLGRGRAVTVTSEGGTVAAMSTSPFSGSFTAYTPFTLITPLRRDTTHHLTVNGLVEYAAGCFYILGTMHDRYGNLLIIIQGSPGGPVYLPLVMRSGGGDSGPTLGGRRVFPPDNWWNLDISSYPVDPNSDNYIASINSDPDANRNGAGQAVLHADFGSNLEYGIPYTIVPVAQPMVPITFTESPHESDPGPYPIPLDVPIEFGSDHDALVVNSGNCVLYEMYHTRKDINGPGWLTRAPSLP